jgi:hypothetical protein
MASGGELPVRSALRTPRSAAVAGIIFAVLLGTALVIVRLAIPSDPEASPEWLENRAGAVRLALGLIPFAGIAFLWFMGVVRDRLGQLEDRFLSTVFIGSGLLFIAMLFVWAAMTGALIASYELDGGTIVDSGVYGYGRQVMSNMSGTYALRMAAVFMASSGTIWFRTGTMPRWLVVVTYGIALMLLLSYAQNLWVSLLVPAWALLVSSYFLFAKRPSFEDDDHARSIPE